MSFEELEEDNKRLQRQIEDLENRYQIDYVLWQKKEENLMLQLKEQKGMLSYANRKIRAMIETMEVIFSIGVEK